MAQLNRRQPARRSVAPAFDKVYEGKNARVLRTMTETGKADPRAFWKQANEVEVIVRRYMQASILRNEMPVPQAMRTAMEEVRGFLGTK